MLVRKPSTLKDDLSKQLRAFQPALACWLGLNEAIVLQHFHTLITESETNFAKGQAWIAKTIPELVNDFPFWDHGVIKRTLKNLKADGLLNVMLDWDRAGRFTWYTIDYAALDRLDGPVNRLQIKTGKRRMARDSRKLDNRPGFVYVCMKRGRKGYKIGLSIDVSARMGQLGARLIQSFPVDNMLLAEQELHRRYDDKRLDGEWFDLSYPELDQLMRDGLQEKGVINTP